MCSHFACTCVCVCVCSSLSQCVSWSTAGSVRTPAFPARCAHVFVSECVCVWERNRQDSPMGPMLSMRKADYGTCQGVRNTPHQHYTDSQLSTHLYGCKCKAPSLLLFSCHLETASSASSSAWYEIRQLLHSYFLAWFTNVCCIFIWMRTWQAGMKLGLTWLD